jgi:hypothetical protein
VRPQQILPASLLHLAGPNPQVAPYSKTLAASGTVVGRTLPALSNCAFGELATLLPQAPAAQPRDVTAHLGSTTEFALYAKPRELQLPAETTFWQVSIASPETELTLRQPEFAQEGLDYSIACPPPRAPSREPEPPSFDEFIRLPQLSGLRAAADLARMADWTQTVLQNAAEPVWKRPREAALPVQFLSSIALRDSPLTQGKWSMSLIDEVRVHPQPGVTQPVAAEERPRAFTRPSPGLKWVASKIPWMPMS